MEHYKFVNKVSGEVEYVSNRVLSVRFDELFNEYGEELGKYYSLYYVGILK